MQSAFALQIVAIGKINAYHARRIGYPCAMERHADADSHIRRTAAAPALVSGSFAAGNGRVLPYQAVKPRLSQPAAMAAGAPSAPPSSACGTILLFHDWGVPFAADTAMLAALTARGFCAVGYEWYCQGSPEKKPAAKTKQAARQAARGKAAQTAAAPHDKSYACRFNSAVLARFLHSIALPEYPAPFYVLAQGLGALFALTCQNALRPAVSRMIAVAPPMRMNGRLPNSLYHYGIKALSLLTRQNKKRKQAAQHSLAYQANLLDHAAFVLSASYAKNMALPCLIISASGDDYGTIAATRLLAENLRFADSLLIAAASPAQLCETASLNPQFWAAFDAFIPGSDATAGNDVLEHAVLL